MKSFDKNDYSVLTEYVIALRQNSSPINVIKPFQFYTYDYDFSKEKPYDIIRFWDMKPLVFVYDAYKTEDGYNFVGLNFHHLPILSRQIWIARLKKVKTESYNRNEKIIMDYSYLRSMFKKASKYGVRQYRRERATGIREIPNTNMDLLMKFYANTYYGATYQNIVSKYKKYKP